MWDAIVIGSGFGGVLAAHPLVQAGLRVLMLERGGWVERGPDNGGARSAAPVTPHFSSETPYDVATGRRRRRMGAWHCVGGQSVFYGGASVRFRALDFEHDPEIVGESGAGWPFDYATMEPYYAAAERLLGVAGVSGADPTEPPRSEAYPRQPGTLVPSARRIAEAARSLGLRPFRIPLATTYDSSEGRRASVGCGTCDDSAAAAEAKNDVATGILPELVRHGLTLWPNTVATRLVRAGARITHIEYVDRVTGERGRLNARVVVLAAGALATPHLLLASGLASSSSAPQAIGRYLMRHRNAVVFGVFRAPLNAVEVFDKQIGIHDFYFGHPAIPTPRGKLGGIQQLTPPLGLVRAYAPWVLRLPAGAVMSRCSGLLTIAEDQPRIENAVTADWNVTDRYGRPGLRVRHRYTARDVAAAAALVSQAKRILRATGASLTWVHPIDTFSHALGTVRMGPDPRTAPLDEHGRFRGLENLFVTDASALPRSAGVNPSLTIAANALRVGERLAGERIHTAKLARTGDRPLSRP